VKKEKEENVAASLSPRSELEGGVKESNLEGSER